MNISIEKNKELRCINLGYDYKSFDHPLWVYFDAKIDITQNLVLSLKNLFTFIVNIPGCKFYVCKHSKMMIFLHDHINKENVNVINTIDNIEKIILNKKSFIFFDNEEMEDKNLLDIKKILYRFPPSVLNIGKIIALNMNFDYFFNLSKFIDSFSKRTNEKFISVAPSPTSCCINDILYLLCDSIKIVSQELMRRCKITDENLSINSAQFYNCFDSHSESLSTIVINYDGPTSYRRNIENVLGVSNKKLFFLYGTPAKRSTKCLPIKPFIIWSYPNAGTNRFMHVFSRICNAIGITQDAWGFHDSKFTDKNPKNLEDNNLYNKHYKEINRVIEIYNILKNDSYISLHHPYYQAQIAEEINSKIVILIRDMRDIIISSINWLHGAEIVFGKKKMKDFLLDFMKGSFSYEKGYHHNSSLLSNWYYLDLNSITRQLVQLKKYDNVYIIKFEDIHENPVKAYRDLFDFMGFTNDPFWVEEFISPFLKSLIKESTPSYVKEKHKDRYGLLSGKPGSWKLHFTEEEKNYFKNNSNNFLYEFGYELDDNW